MPEGYGSHKDYIGWVEKDANSRQKTIAKSLHRAFSSFIEKRKVEVILFSSMSAYDLAKALSSYPLILKPLLAACNIAARAIERDLSIKNLDTYDPRLTDEQAAVIAGYVKPFLPSYLELPTLVRLDRIAFVDKEIRKEKGQWEKKILRSINQFANMRFVKRSFVADGEEFEIDAASPQTGDIQVGIDIKRIEARRDIHKRCDEIVNKAAKLNVAYPSSKFGVVIYYPFIEEHTNVQNRLHSEKISGIVFASEAKDSIDNAVRMILPVLGVQSK